MGTSENSQGDPRWSLESRREPKTMRAAAGRERRDTVPLEAHADLDVSAERASALSILQAQDANRLQDLVPIRYGRMLATPFTFLRGSAAVMATDLAAGPRTEVGEVGPHHLGQDAAVAPQHPALGLPARG